MEWVPLIIFRAEGGRVGPRSPAHIYLTLVGYQSENEIISPGSEKGTCVFKSSGISTNLNIQIEGTK